MNYPNQHCSPYKQQIERAKEMLGILESDLHNVRRHLQQNPENANGLRELKRINLEMTITLNELEHNQQLLDHCRAQHRNAGFSIAD